jgi:transposase InsO family protein
MLVMVDHFSRFTILRALLDKSSTTIAKELLNIFCLFSFPKVLSCDNGTEFISDIVSQLIIMSGIDRQLSLPYTPQGNAVCERFVGIAKQSIVKLLNGKHDDWDLLYILIACS